MAARSTKADLNPTTPSDGYRSKPTSSAGRSVRLMSAFAVADMLDVNRGTVRRWKTDGMPVVSDPEAGGDAYTIELAEVVKWLIERVVNKEVEKAREKAPGGPGGMPGMPPGFEPPAGWESEEEANRRRAVALANIAEMDEEIKAGTVVPMEAVEDLLRKEHAAARAKLENRVFDVVVAPADVVAAGIVLHAAGGSFEVIGDRNQSHDIPFTCPAITASAKRGLYRRMQTGEVRLRARFVENNRYGRNSVHDWPIVAFRATGEK